MEMKRVLRNLRILWVKFHNEDVQTPYVSSKMTDYNCISFYQPYYVNTIRIRLWDFDERKQSFTITALKGLGPVFSDEKENETGWQVFTFPPMAIDMITITPIKSTIGNDFRVAYVEVYLDL